MDSKILHWHLKRRTARIIFRSRIAQDDLKIKVYPDLIVYIFACIEDPVPARAASDIKTDSLAAQHFLATFSHGTHTSTSFQCTTQRIHGLGLPRFPQLDEL